MKNTKTLSILVVLFIAGSISGLSLTGCNRFNRSNTGRFTLTGIPSQYNGKYAYFVGSNVDDAADSELVYGVIITVKGEIEFPQIKGRSVTFPLRNDYISYGLENMDSYRRSEALGISIYIYDEILDPSIMDNWICYVTFNSVAFSDGNAKRAWSAADDVYERR